MEKYSWIAKVKKGCLEEYITRHNNLWPELKDLLKSGGICNYSIWTDGELLFGYYECEYGIDAALKVQKNSEVVDKWNEYMKDILIMQINEKTGGQPVLTQVFNLD
jgi:L-rhamnose mutarotase